MPLLLSQCLQQAELAMDEGLRRHSFLELLASGSERVFWQALKHRFILSIKKKCFRLVRRTLAILVSLMRVGPRLLIVSCETARSSSGKQVGFLRAGTGLARERRLRPRPK